MLRIVIYFLFFLSVSIANKVMAQITESASEDLIGQLKTNPDRNAERVLLLNQLAYVYVYADPVSSLKYSFEAKNIADSIRFTEGQAEANRQIGLAYGSQADFSAAINYLLEGLRIAELNRHIQVEADITGNIGTMYNSMGNPTEALTFLLDARQLQKRLLNRQRESAVINNIGDSYFALKQFDKAKEAYATALEYSKQSNYKLGITTNLRNLGNILEVQGQYDSALVRYLKCIGLSEEINDHRGYILSHKSVASAYFKIKKISQAKEYAQIALDAAVKERLRSFVRDICELMYKISESEHNKAQSFKYYKLFVLYKDSVQNLKVGSEITAQRLYFETNKKQAEIELLKKDRELQSDRLTIKNTQLGFAVLLTLLSILFLVPSIRSYNRIKIKNRELSKKNEEIHQQHLQIKSQHDELVILNEELKSQQEEVMTQRDSLAEKNKEIEAMSGKIAEVNASLEELVKHRTEELENQNTRLAGYAFLNAHKLRAPLARIMGLINLLQMKSDKTEVPVIMSHLNSSTDELEEVVNSISKTIREEFDKDVE